MSLCPVEGSKGVLPAAPGHSSTQLPAPGKSMLILSLDAAGNHSPIDLAIGSSRLGLHFYSTGYIETQVQQALSLPVHNDTGESSPQSRTQKWREGIQKGETCVCLYLR